jgi:hypothetical protein
MVGGTPETIQSLLEEPKFISLIRGVTSRRLDYGEFIIR